MLYTMYMLGGKEVLRLWSTSEAPPKAIASVLGFTAIGGCTAVGIKAAEGVAETAGAITANPFLALGIAVLGIVGAYKVKELADEIDEKAKANREAKWERKNKRRR